MRGGDKVISDQIVGVRKVALRDGNPDVEHAIGFGHLNVVCSSGEFSDIVEPEGDRS
jgi:hypothetical protein